MKDGLWYDDNDFIYRMTKVANVHTIDSNRYFGIHQHHISSIVDEFNFLQNKNLVNKNKVIYEKNKKDQIVYCNPENKVKYLLLKNINNNIILNINNIDISIKPNLNNIFIPLSYNIFNQKTIYDIKLHEENELYDHCFKYFSEDNKKTLLNYGLNIIKKYTISNSDNIKISFIMSYRNRIELLFITLIRLNISLLNNFEVVIVDDRSEHSIEWLKYYGFKYPIKIINYFVLILLIIMGVRDL